MRSEPLVSPGLARREFLKGVVTCLACEALPTRTAWAGGLHVGAPAPAATLVTLDGERISTSDLRGQVVILTFWATWCSPCREELPEVRRVAQSLRFPVGLMSASSAPGYGRIWRLPVSFTIDREGLLAENGWKQKQAAWTRERLDQFVTPLLAASGRT